MTKKKSSRKEARKRKKGLWDKKYILALLAFVLAISIFFGVNSIINSDIFQDEEDKRLMEEEVLEEEAEIKEKVLKELEEKEEAKKEGKDEEQDEEKNEEKKTEPEDLEAEKEEVRQETELDPEIPKEEGKKEVAEPSSEEPKELELEKKPDFVNQGGVVYLTMDDGPSAFTKDILDCLDSYGAKMTFFMLDSRMKAFPEELRRMVNSSHGVGLHGVSHNKNQFYKSKDTVLGEMYAAQETLESITGKKSFLIRTPYGSHPHMTKEYRQAVDEAGFRMWDWNVDSLDWKYRDERMLTTISNQVENLKAKGLDPVVLIHDREQTLKYLPEILTYFQERGYEFRILREDMANLTF